jgi:hypothetical protein
MTIFAADLTEDPFHAGLPAALRQTQPTPDRSGDCRDCSEQKPLELFDNGYFYEPLCAECIAIRIKRNEDGPQA